MTLASDIKALLEVAGVTELVQDRIYPVLAPQNAQRPFVVWRRDGGDPLATLSGNSARRQFFSLLIGAYAETFDEADRLADAIVAAINAASGSGKGTVTAPVDGYEPETKSFSVLLQARLFYRA